MMRLNMIYRQAFGIAIFSIGLIYGLPLASAGTFNWGDLSDPGGDVMYLNVEENNSETTSLYAPEPGVGSPTVVGNSISFDPQGFQSQASGGTAHMIDSQMSTTIMAKDGQAVESIAISELGDYTLDGLTGGEAMASVGAAFFWTIEEINGVPNPQPTQTQSMQFTTGGGVNGGEYFRPGDEGTAAIWSGSVFIDVRDYLNSNGLGDAFATKVRLTFDNTLQTAADAVSNAFIKKKELGGSVVVTVDTSAIPEPATIVLAGIALAGVAVRRRFA
jgi:hypothetical protein